jgi:hypothetical protein
MCDALFSSTTSRTTTGIPLSWKSTALECHFLGIPRLHVAEPVCCDCHERACAVECCKHCTGCAVCTEIEKATQDTGVLQESVFSISQMRLISDGCLAKHYARRHWKCIFSGNPRWCKSPSGIPQVRISSNVEFHSLGTLRTTSVSLQWTPLRIDRLESVCRVRLESVHAPCRTNAKQKQPRSLSLPVLQSRNGESNCATVADFMQLDCLCCTHSQKFLLDSTTCSRAVALLCTRRATKHKGPDSPLRCTL